MPSLDELGTPDQIAACDLHFQFVQGKASLK